MFYVLNDKKTLDEIFNKFRGVAWVNCNQFFVNSGFPASIQPGPNAFYATYPSRFEYPGKEQALNAESYNTAISRQGPDEITTPVWWER